MRRLLFNPGPTNVADEVRAALMSPDFSHRDPEFREVLHRVSERLVTLLGGAGSHRAVMFASSGTGANEAMLSALDGKILLLQNGRYSARLAAIAERHGIPLRTLVFAPFDAIDLDEVERALRADPDLTHIALVHLETTTGVLAPLRGLGELAREYGKPLIVDAISSVAGAPFHLQDDNVAFCSVNPNKCLEALPGIAFVVARVEELERLAGRSRSFYFDLHEQWRRLERDEVPYTAPVQTVLAFDVALERLEREGYSNRLDRYARHAEHLRAGLRRMGVRLVDVPTAARSNVVIPAHMPAGLDFAALWRYLHERLITIYTASGELAEGRFFFAPMGAIQADDVDRFLHALEAGMRAQGCLPEVASVEA